jgi:hypothetical protein
MAVGVTAISDSHLRLEWFGPPGSAYCPMTGTLVTTPCENCTPGQPHVGIDALKCPGVTDQGCTSYESYEASHDYIPTGFVLVGGDAQLTLTLDHYQSGSGCASTEGYRYSVTTGLLTRHPGL